MPSAPVLSRGAPGCAPPRPDRPARRAGLFLLGLLSALSALPLGACQNAARLHASPAPDAARPARRTGGPRLPAPFGGADPASLGLVQAEGLVWLEGADAPLWGPGGQGVRPQAGAPPGQGLTLRSHHVALATDLPAPEALPLLRAAQQQVEALLAAYGEALDLRLPAEPLPVTVFARRADFEALLATVVAEPTGWNAFYDARDGRVRVCAEPSPLAPLPVLADLRHELTHAVLDLSAPAPVPHDRILAGLHFWLWEGIAVHAETLTDPAGAGSAALRRQRLAARAAQGELTPVPALLRLPQTGFEGRHYDQVASVMRFLLADPELAPRTLQLLRRLLRGDVLQNDPARDLGLSLEELDRRWRSAWAQGRA